MRTTSPRRAFESLLLLLIGGVFAWSALAGGAGKPTPARRADDSSPSERYVPTREELEAVYQRQPPPRPQPGVFKAEIVPHWFADNTRFWYRNDLRGGAKEFILVDAGKGRRDIAFDHKKVAESLSKAAEKECTLDRLPFDSIEFVDDGKAVQFQVADVVWKCDLASYECTKVKIGQKPPADEQAAKHEDEAETDAPEAREEFTAFQRPRPDDAGRE